MSSGQPDWLQQCDDVLLLENGLCRSRREHPNLIPVPSPALEPKDNDCGDVGGASPLLVPEAGDTDAIESLEEDGQSSLENPEMTFLAPEGKADGQMSQNIYLSYFESMGYMLPLGFVSYTLTYCCMGAADLWLCHWITTGNTDALYPMVYIILALFNLIGFLGSSVLVTMAAVEASRNLHRECVNRLLYAPLGWFEASTTGRISSRFSSDLARIDKHIPFSFDTVIQCAFAITAYNVIVAWIFPLAMPAFVVLVVGLSIVVEVINRSNREVKRLANNAASPVVSNMSEVQQGVPFIRFTHSGAFFRERHHFFTDNMVRLNVASGSVMTFGWLVAALIASGCSMIAASVVFSSPAEEAYVALAVTYSFLVPYFLGHTMNYGSQFLLFCASLERLLEYRELPQEAPHSCETDPDLATWPRHGGICFEEVSCRYHASLPLVLEGVSFDISGGEHIGIVGRTGAGKSTLISMLFRLVEPASGNVSIDGRSTLEVGLEVLRSRLGIIPQQPILMEGDIAQNLLPFANQEGEDTEKAMKRTLSLAGLSHLPLTYRVEKGGDNLSAGERQLVCFARALLQDRKILIMDEPTSNIDLETDEIIQSVVDSEALTGVTTLTIAHRLLTVANCGRIMVMDQGRVAEFAPAAELISRQGSLFGQMVAALGPKAAKAIQAKAEGPLRGAV